MLDSPDAAEVVGCEQFGPVLPILALDDETEAIARANNTPFGLCSSIWTSDETRAFDLADRLDAGTTFINGHSLFTVDLEAPFGAVKQSGIGRALGPTPSGSTSRPIRSPINGCEPTLLLPDGLQLLSRS